MINRLILKYPVKEYDFRFGVQMALGRDNLETIHEHLPNYDRFSREQDQSTELHQAFYREFSRWGETLDRTYNRFIHNFIAPMIGEPFAYQTIPTFRVHLPNNLAVGEFHKDSDYGHSEHEINFWLPVTGVNTQNCVWVETAPGSGSMSPFLVRYGYVGVFDAANLKHGNLENASSQTRISFDFRVIPESVYTPSEKVSINTGKQFSTNGYFSWKG